jgi:Ca-activated chloride channel homolog
LELLKNGFEMLVDELDGTDRIAIVTYAGADKVVLESTYCDEKSKIKRALRDLDSGGSTAGAQGIITAYEIAKKNFIPGGNNRVIVGSDGDFNVGPSSTEELVKLIEEKRKSGIYLTVLGVGQGNLNDAMMEQLANNGNGNYEYIDNLEQLKKVFVYEKQKFYTVAEDCKIQLTFNEKSVDSYRLIGYENRVLENEEFENDTVDAGEIGASQTITAFYEIIPAENPEGPFCELEFRYKKPGTKNSILLTHEAVDQADSFESASENMRFGAALTGFGLLMKKSEYKGNLTFDDVIDWGQTAVGDDLYGFRSEFLELVETAKSIQ